jgi:hypothetical protein
VPEVLESALDYFGAERSLEGIGVSDVRAWSVHLHTMKGTNGRQLGVESTRRHLFALSNLYRFAQEEELVPPGFNPVSLFTEKPASAKCEARWLEIHDTALVLEAARTLPTVSTAAGEAMGADLAYPLVATFLLTAGRRALGLERCER